MKDRAPSATGKRGSGTAGKPDPVERFAYESKKRRTLSGLAQLALDGDRDALQTISGHWAHQVFEFAQSIADLDDRDALMHLVAALEQMGPAGVWTRRSGSKKMERAVKGASPDEAFGWNRNPKARGTYETLFEDSERARAVAYFRQKPMSVDDAVQAANAHLYPGQHHEEAIRAAYKRSKLGKSR